MLVRISVVIANPNIATLVSETLSDFDADVQLHPLDGPFWEQASAPSDILLVCMQRLPQPADDSVRSLCDSTGSPKVVVLADGDAKLQATLLACGAAAVLDPNVDRQIWRDALKTLALRTQQQIDEKTQAEIDHSQSTLPEYQSLTPRLQRFVQEITHVSVADSPVLIVGEVGVGKERLARAIHQQSPRRDSPFVPIRCALPDEQLEAELFGYQKGVVGQRRSNLDLAHRGTLFFDEIGELRPPMQTKLLQTLQEKTAQRPGGGREPEANVRVIAATNRNLQDEISAGRFRRDLYHLLSTSTLEVPPLRKRPEDISHLLERHLNAFRISIGRHVTGFTDDALEALRAYAWPGNVRELINVVERGVLLCSGQEITLTDLPLDVIGAHPNAPKTLNGQATSPDWLPKDWRDLPWTQLRTLLVSACEQEYLEHHLTSSKGRIGVVSERTGLSHRAVNLMMKRRGVQKDPYRKTKGNSPGRQSSKHQS